MGRRANPMAVKSALAYEITEAAVALGVTPATIRNWINDGMPAMASRRPYLILGANIRTYLRAKYAKAKTPLASDELFCPTCGRGRAPAAMQVTCRTNTPKTELLQGICSHCGSISNRMISTMRHPEFAETFKITKAAPSEA